MNPHRKTHREEEHRRREKRAFFSEDREETLSRGKVERERKEKMKYCFAYSLYICYP